MPDAGDRTRILFLNQGQAVPRSPLGSVRVQQVYENHFPAGADVDARFRTLRRFNLAERLAVTPAPGLLGRGYSDLRWFALRSLNARHVLREEIKTWHPSVAHVVVNGSALFLSAIQDELPCVPAFDTALSEWMRLMHRLPAEEPLARPWRILEDLERRSLRSAPLAISWTEHVSAALRALAPDTRIETLHPGLDTRRFTPRLGSRRPGPMRILFVGGRFAAKGGPTLLAAAEGLGRPVEVHAVTTERVGSHPLLTLHRARPGTSDTADLFRDADLFCLPTAWDAVPWAVLEAEASGLPVVSTSVGSIPELVPAGCGRIVPPNDVRSLRTALTDLVEDDGASAALAAMGARGRAHVEAMYDADRTVARLAELLSSVAR